MRLEIRLLGGLSVRRQGEIIEDWGSEQTKSLLKILVSEPGRAFLHEQLIEYIWPDTGYDQALSFLRARIHNLRQKLEPNSKSSHSIIETIAGGYRFRLTDECHIDTIQFAKLLKQAERAKEEEAYAEALELYERAIERYGGEYLPEDRYEEWARDWRRLFEGMYVQALVDLAECCVCEGQHRRAVELCRQAYALDPYSEDIYRNAMTYAHLMGNSNQALKIYEECCEVMRAEQGKDPDGDTMTLRDQIASGHVPGIDPEYKRPVIVQHPVHHSLGRLPFVGRERELHDLCQLLREVKSGQGKCAFIGGGAGIGKTRLVQEAIQIAQHDLGFDTLFGRFNEFGTDVPYHTFIELIRGRMRSLSDEELSKLPHLSISVLLPWLPGVDLSCFDFEPLPELAPEQERLRFFEAITQLLNAFSELKSPLLVFLDDLHWADASSIDLLGYILHRAEDSKLLLIGTYRAEETSQDEPLAKLLRRADRDRAENLARHMQLESLEDQHIIQLLDQCAGLIENESEFGSYIYAQSSGNPLFVVSLLQSLFEEKLIEVTADGKWLPAVEAIEQVKTRTLPREIQDLIHRRIERLDAGLRGLLECASVVVTNCSKAVLGKLWNATSSEESVQEYAQNLEKLQDMHILVNEPAGYRFSHEKIREVVYSAIPSDQKKMLHQAYAEILEEKHKSETDEATRPYELFAFHYRRAGLDWRAAQDYLAALRQATRGYRIDEGLTLANELLGILAIMETDVVDESAVLELRYETLQQRVQILEILAKRDEQEQDANALVEIAEQIGDAQKLAEAHLAQAKVKIRTSSYDEAQVACYRALAVAKEGDDPQLEVKCLHSIALLMWYMEEYDEAEAYFTHELNAHTDSVDVSLLAQSFHYLGAISWRRGEYDDAEKYYNQALKLRDAEKAIPGKASTLMALGTMYGSKGDYQKSIETHEEVRALAAKIGDRRGEARALGNLGRTASLMGDYSISMNYFKASIRIHESMGDLKALALDLNNFGVLQWYLGQNKEAKAYFDRALQLYKEIGSTDGEMTGKHNLGLVQWRLGRFEDAIELCDTVLESHRRKRNERSLGRLLRNMGEIYVDLGKHEEALEYLREANVLSRAFSATIDEIHANCNMALCYLQMGKLELALEHSEHALDILQEQDHKVCLPLVWYVRFKVLHQVGEQESAKVALENAHGALTALSSKIDDLALRSSYLNNVPLNREILAQYGGSLDEFELSEEQCYEILRCWRWPKQNSCTYCDCSQVRIHGHVSNSFEKRYLCTACNKTFGDRTQTVFANSNLPITKLFRAVLIVSSLNEKKSAKKAIAEKLGIHSRTANNLYNKLEKNWESDAGLVRLAEMIKESC